MSALVFCSDSLVLWRMRPASTLLAASGSERGTRLIKEVEFLSPFRRPPFRNVLIETSFPMDAVIIFLLFADNALALSIQV